MTTRKQLRSEAEALRAQVVRQCFHVHSLIAALDSASDPAVERFAEMAQAGLATAGDALDQAESGTVSATWALVGGGLKRG
jgi:hypothetical protein